VKRQAIDIDGEHKMEFNPRSHLSCETGKLNGDIRIRVEQ